MTRYHSRRSPRLQYVADSNVARESREDRDGFACGGRRKRKRAELRAHGGRSKPRNDKRPRASRNISPMNYGHHDGAGFEEPLQREHPPKKAYARGGRAHLQDRKSVV